MSSLARKHFEPISKIQYSDLPKDVVHKIKLLIAHCLGSACVGAGETWTKAALATHRQMDAQGNAKIWFSSETGSAFAAAYVNGVAAQSSGQEDVHPESAVHGGIIVLPTALSLADVTYADGKALFTAIAAGYEFLCRIGRCGADPEITRRGFRPTTVFGVFGACVSASFLLGLSLEEILSALGIAGNYCAGVNEWAKAGTDDIFLQNGLCAATGILSACMAKSGLPGSEYIFEGSDGASGVCNAFGFNRRYLDKAPTFQGEFSLETIVCKSSPSCLFTQTTARVAEMAVHAGIDADSIEFGKIWTTTKARDYGFCNNPGPFHGLIQARNSHQYVAASAILYRGISNACFVDFRNPLIEELASRFTVCAKEEYDAVFPERQPGSLELTLKNGSTVIFSLDDSRWLTEDEIWTLFEENLSGRFSRKQIKKIRAGIESLDAADRTEEFTRLLI